jgi:hypothetical protein
MLRRSKRSKNEVVASKEEEEEEEEEDLHAHEADWERRFEMFCKARRRITN